LTGHLANTVKRFLCFGLFTMLTSGAKAVDLPPCGPNVHPLDCYVNSSKIAVMFGELEARLAVSRYRQGQHTHAEMLSAIKNNVTSYRENIEPRFQAAARHLAGNKDALNVLKDYHAYWIGTLEGLMQEPSESEGAFKRRVAERQSALDDKRNRLLLEK